MQSLRIPLLAVCACVSVLILVFAHVTDSKPAPSNRGLGLGLGGGFGRDSQQIREWHEEVLQPDVYVVQWEPDYEAQTVTFRVVAQTKGYVGFGISNSGEMAGADIVVGGVDSDGEVYFADYYAGGHGLPVVDESQDWTLLSAEENDTHTELTFMRAFDTGDAIRDTAITYDETHFIWALATEDGIRFHQSRGSKAVRILESDSEPCVQRRLIESEEMLADNYLVRWAANLDTQTIEFQVIAETTGYVGFGFSPGTTMAGAEIVVGGVNEEGVNYFTAYHSISNSQPVEDEVQDIWNLLAASENGTHTELRFSRVFDTGIENDIPITTGPMNLIWAIRNVDAFSYHGFGLPSRGHKVVTLMEEDPGCPTTTPPNPTEDPCLELEHHELEFNENYTLRWTNDYSTRTTQFHITVATLGYVGLGISDGAGMSGADIIIGGVDENGVGYVQDSHAIGHSVIIDESQSWELISAVENETHTELVYSRPFNTGDEHDAVITGQPTNFIWAFGLTDVISRHARGNRGFVPVTILQTSECIPPVTTPTPAPEEPTTPVTVAPPTPCFSSEEMLGENYIVRWVADYDTQSIEFQVTVATKGYVGFGLSPGGNMVDSELVVGGQNEDGTSYFTAYHGVSNSRPIEDEVQDIWKLLSVAENNTHTEMRFSRVFDTGVENDIRFTTEPAYLVWAFGSGESGDSFSYHGTANRGNKLVTLLHESCIAPEPCPEPEQEMELYENYVLRWVSDHATQKVQFHVTAATTGYVGFGISNEGAMTGADLLIAGVQPSGEVYFRDYHGVGNMAPVLDESQDWVLHSIAENETHTDIIFSRAFDTGDEHDTIITDAPTNFIWAIGGDDVINYHPFRGSEPVTIIGRSPCTTEPTPPPHPCVFSQEKTLNDTYFVRWSTDFEAHSVQFQVIVETLGYIRFGISNDGEMEGADLIVGGVLPISKKSYFADYYGTDNVYPFVDASQDWNLTSYSENDTHTELIFQRAFDTGDKTHDVVITDSEMYFIWSYGLTDNAGYPAENRGSKLVKILEPTDECTMPPPTTRRPNSASMPFSSGAFLLLMAIGATLLN